MANLEELVDIEKLKLDNALPKDIRIKKYIEQILNPYCFKYKEMKLSVSFCGETSLEDEIIDYIKNN